MNTTIVSRLARHHRPQGEPQVTTDCATILHFAALRSHNTLMLSHLDGIIHIFTHMEFKNRSEGGKSRFTQISVKLSEPMTQYTIFSGPFEVTKLYGQMTRSRCGCQFSGPMIGAGERRVRLSRRHGADSQPEGGAEVQGGQQRRGPLRVPDRQLQLAVHENLTTNVSRMSSSVWSGN